MALLPKGQTEGLTAKSVQAGDKTFYVGAAWDGDVDLDLMVVPVKDGKKVENQIVYFSNLAAYGDGIKHSGDALDGDAPGDDESVVIEVGKVDADAIVIGVIAYNVPDMSEAKNTKFTIRDGKDESAPILYELPMSDDDVDGETILVSCVLQRNGDQWTAKNVGDFVTKFSQGMPAVNGLAEIAGGYCTA